MIGRMCRLNSGGPTMEILAAVAGLADHYVCGWHNGREPQRAKFPLAALTLEPTPEESLLVWLDFETLGLDPKTCAILEVGCVVTDGLLREIASPYFAVTDAARRVAIADVHPKVADMHLKSGLWVESLTNAPPLTEAAALAGLADYIRALIPAGLAKSKPGGAQLAGSTISFDRGFLVERAPAVLDLVHYRNLDTSSLNEAARRFWPQVWRGRPHADEHKVAHRSVADCRAAIEVARYYREALTPTIRVVAGSTCAGAIPMASPTDWPHGGCQ